MECVCLCKIGKLLVSKFNTAFYKFTKAFNSFDVLSGFYLSGPSIIYPACAALDPDVFVRISQGKFETGL